jgi:hypothetical protein
MESLQKVILYSQRNYLAYDIFYNPQLIYY